ncbi:MAG: HAD family hydrolase [Brachyspira sp.]|nr:HAD family hydrolase [Brachyspira sp.]
MIKMVATDIDGTIIKWGCDFSDGVKKCMKRLHDNGVKVVLVTGRMHCATTPVAERLGLKTPIVSYQGGLVKNQNGETLYCKNLNVEDAKKIIKWARENNVHINLYLNDELFVEKDNDFVKKYTDGKFISYKVCSFDDLNIENVNKILAIDFNDEHRVTGWVDELQKAFPNLYIVKSTPYFCEIGSCDAKKSAGVEFLANEWGIKKEEILTIGDQDNDIELLKSGGVPVAMGNASEELKKYACYITDTVENDGFVKAVEKYVFGE